MKPAEYRGSITRESYLFHEMRVVAKLIMQDKEEKDIYEEILQNNLFQFPTERNIKSISIGCYRRLMSMESKELINVIAEGAVDVAKQACMFSLMSYNRLIYEFMTEVIGEKYKNNDLSFDKAYISRFLYELQQKDEKVASWSDSTIHKIKSVMLKCLVESGYLESTKAKELNPVFLFDEVKEAIEETGDTDSLVAFNCLD